MWCLKVLFEKAVNLNQWFECYGLWKIQVKSYSGKGIANIKEIPKLSETN